MKNNNKKKKEEEEAEGRPGWDGTVGSPGLLPLGDSFPSVRTSLLEPHSTPKAVPASHEHQTHESKRHFTFNAQQGLIQ